MGKRAGERRRYQRATPPAGTRSLTLERLRKMAALLVCHRTLISWLDSHSMGGVHQPGAGSNQIRIWPLFSGQALGLTKTRLRASLRGSLYVALSNL